MAVSAKATAHELVKLLADNAEQLRKAGVVRLKLDGLLEADLLPHIPEGPRTKAEDDEQGDPLNDPATFDQGPGSRLPGYDLPKRRRDEDAV